ncbi:hypothetical protein G7Z17_g1853 [Cylindrodendrum hubeiense]|uniref:Peptidase M14 domain-containing protein n=1 Tax=Cylindrodendrum hubeiense TaxID=595255 RepID=A0A9P5HE12_9HYPO|nr:hypothetical protein G7Z17_g1853 [Cylindrodendrum hubeiense]
MKLYSPAFLYSATIPSGFAFGTEGPTDQEVMDSFLQKLSRKNSWMKYGDKNKVRVWVQGAVHGNEPGSDQAVMALLGALDSNQTWAHSLLEQLDIFVLPRYNPDGVYYFQDRLATNFDPNRDHTKVARKHTKNIKSELVKFAPHVAVDMHEYTATRQYGRWYHGSDALFAPAKNLNVHKNIRALGEGLFSTNIEAALEAKGLRWETYVTGTAGKDLDMAVTFTEAGSDAKIGRNAIGLTQAVAFLSETRGIQLADQHFQRRVATGLTLVSSILQTAADHASEVYSIVEESIDDFISGWESDEIVITDSPVLTNRTFTLIDVTNGSLVQGPVQFRSTSPVVANLTRIRPEAYLIPAGWADLAKRLQYLGLVVEVLDKSWTGKVEALNITSCKFGSKYYEGAVRARVTADVHVKEVKLPVGSFYITTRQKNAAMAFMALEPENIDSFASFNIIAFDVGDEYQIYRLMT